MSDNLLTNGKLKASAESYFKEHTNKAIEDDKTKILVGEVNERIIAYVIGNVGQEHPILDFGNQALIDDLYVCIEFQRLGYANILIDTLIEWFCENEVKRIDLNVYDINPKGSAFWKEKQFENLFKRLTKKV